MAARQRRKLSIPPVSEKRVIAEEDEDDELPALKEQEQDDTDESSDDLDRDELSDCSDLPGLHASSDDGDDSDESDESDDATAPTLKVSGSTVKKDGLQRGFFQAKVTLSKQTTKQTKQTTGQTRDNTVKTSSNCKTEQTSDLAPGVVPSTRTHLSQGSSNITGGLSNVNSHENDDGNFELDGDANGEGGDSPAHWYERVRRARLAQEHLEKKRLEAKKARQERKKKSHPQEIEVAEELSQLRKLERLKELEELRKSGILPRLVNEEDKGNENQIFIGRCRNSDKNKCPNSSQPVVSSQRRYELSCTEGCFMMFHASCFIRIKRDMVHFQLEQGAPCLTPDCEGFVNGAYLKEKEKIVYSVVDGKKKEKEIATVPFKEKEKRQKFLWREEEVKKKNNLAVEDPLSQRFRKTSRTFQPKGQQDESNVPTTESGQSSRSEKVPENLAEKVSGKASENVNQQESTSEATTSKSVNPGSQTIQAEQVMETPAVVKKSLLPIDDNVPLRLVVRYQEEELVVGNKAKRAQNKKVSKQGKAKGSSIHLSEFMAPETTNAWNTEHSGHSMSKTRNSASALANTNGSHSGQVEDDRKENSKKDFPLLASEETRTRPASLVEDKPLVTLLGDLIVPPTELLSCKPLHLLVENVDSSVDDLEIVERFTKGGACVEEIKRFWDLEIAVVTFSRFEEALTAQVLNRSDPGSSQRLHCSHLLRQQPYEGLARNSPPLTASSNTVTSNPSVTANPSVVNIVSGESSQPSMSTSQIHEHSEFIGNLPAASATKLEALLMFSLQPSAPAFFPSTLTDQKTTTINNTNQQSNNSVLLKNRRHEQVEQPLQSFVFSSGSESSQPCLSSAAGAVLSKLPSKPEVALSSSSKQILSNIMSGKTTSVNQLKANAEEFVLPQNSSVISERTAEPSRFPPQLYPLNVPNTGETSGNKMLNTLERGDTFDSGGTGEIMTWQQMDLYQGDPNVSFLGNSGGLFMPGHQPFVTGPIGGINDGMTWQQKDLMFTPAKLRYSFGQIIAATEEEMELYRLAPTFWLNPQELVCPHQICPRQSALFMFDPQSGRIHGIYESITHGLDNMSLIHGGGQLAPVCFQVVIDYPVLHERQLGLVIPAGHFEDHNWDLPLYLTGEQVQDLMDLFEQLSTSDNKDTGADLMPFSPNSNHPREQLVPEYVGPSCTTAPGLFKKSPRNSSSQSLSSRTSLGNFPSGSSVPEPSTGESSGGAQSPPLDNKNSAEVAESQPKQILLSSKPLGYDDKSSKGNRWRKARLKPYAVSARRPDELTDVLSGDKGAIAVGIQQKKLEGHLKKDFGLKSNHAESFVAKTLSHQRLDSIEKVDFSENGSVLQNSSGSRALQTNNQRGKNIENGLVCAQMEEIDSQQGVTKHLKEITRSYGKDKQAVLPKPPGFPSRPSNNTHEGIFQVPSQFVSPENFPAPAVPGLGQISCDNVSVTSGSSPFVRGASDSDSQDKPKQGNVINSNGNFDSPVSNHVSAPATSATPTFEQQEADVLSKFRHLLPLPPIPSPGHHTVSNSQDSLPPDATSGEKKSEVSLQGTRSTATEKMISSTSHSFSTAPPSSYNPMGLKVTGTTSSSSIAQKNPLGSLNEAGSMSEDWQIWPSLPGTLSIPPTKREKAGKSGTRPDSSDRNFPWVYKLESKRFHRVRSGPSVRFEDLGVLRPGALLVVEEQDGDWLRLVVPGYSQCWSLLKDCKADVVFLKRVSEKLEFSPIINATTIEDMESALSSTSGTHGKPLHGTSAWGHQMVSSHSTLPHPHQEDSHPILSVTRNSYRTELVTGSAEGKGKKTSPSSQTQSSTSTSAPPVYSQAREVKNGTDLGLVANNSATVDPVLRSLPRKNGQTGVSRGNSTVQSSAQASGHLCTFCSKRQASYLVLNCAHYGPCEICRHSLSITHCRVCDKEVQSLQHFKWS